MMEAAPRPPSARILYMTNRLADQREPPHEELNVCNVGILAFSCVF